MAKLPAVISIGELSARSGVAASALRFYETRGLITAERTPGHQRRYPRHVLRRVAFIRAAQQVGLSLDEIGHALQTLPEARTPTKTDWTRVSRAWSGRLDQQIADLQRLQAKLTGCVGCGCLSLRTCPLNNPDDEQGAGGVGPAWLSTPEHDGRSTPANGPTRRGRVNRT